MDVLAEGIHFRLDWTSFRDLGYKAAAVNLSDLAAMGAEAEGLLVGLGAPADAEVEQVVELYEGLNEAGVPVVGGDTTRAPSWFLSVTAFGTSERVPGRAGARSRRRARRHRPVGRLGRRPPRPRARPRGLRRARGGTSPAPASPRGGTGAGPRRARAGRPERRDRLGRGADRRALGLQGRPRSRGDSPRAADRRSRRPPVLDARRGLRAFGCARPGGCGGERLHRRRPRRGRLRRRARTCPAGTRSGPRQLCRASVPRPTRSGSWSARRSRSLAARRARRG